VLQSLKDLPVVNLIPVRVLV